MTDRKKPGVAFWATGVVVCLMLYALGFGPAIWLTARGQLDNAVVEWVYWPVLWDLTCDETGLNAPIWWYGSIGVPDGRYAILKAPDKKRCGSEELIFGNGPP
jgi:hypothetical protein